MRVILILLLATAAVVAATCRPLDGYIDPACALPIGTPLPDGGSIDFGALRLLILTKGGITTDNVRNSLAQAILMDPNYIGLGAFYQDENVTLSYATISWPRVLAKVSALTAVNNIEDFLIFCPGGSLARSCPPRALNTVTYATNSDGSLVAQIVLDLEWGLLPGAHLPEALATDLGGFFHGGLGWTILSAANASGLLWAQAYPGLTVVRVAFSQASLYASLAAANIQARANYPVLAHILLIQQECASGLLSIFCDGDQALAAISTQTQNLRIALGIFAGVILGLAAAIIRLCQKLGVPAPKFLTGQASV